MFDPSIWTEARSVPMLSEFFFFFFTASGCSTEQTICSRAQPSCGLQTEEWETDNDGDSEWCKWYRAVGIIQSVRGDEYIPTHASLHVSFWSWWILFLSVFTPSFISILISCLSDWLLSLLFASLPLSWTDQRLDLNKLSPNDSDTVRGQIVGEYGFVWPV